MIIVTNTYNLFNLFKGPTCFKTPKGRSIDLMLTNRKQSSIKSQSFQTGFIDHHHLIYTILKSNFVKLPPKTIRYREYKNFRVENFQTDLDDSLRTANYVNYQLFHSFTISFIHVYACGAILLSSILRVCPRYHHLLLLIILVTPSSSALARNTSIEG